MSSLFFVLGVIFMVEQYAIFKAASILGCLKSVLSVICVIYVPYVVYKVYKYLRYEDMEVYNNYVDYYNNLCDLIQTRNNHIICLSNTVDEINTKLNEMEANGKNLDPDYIGDRLRDAVDDTLEWQASVQAAYDHLSSNDVNRIHSQSRYRLAFLILKVLLCVFLVSFTMALPTFREAVEIKVFQSLDTSIPFDTRVQITNEEVEKIIEHYEEKPKYNNQ